MKYQNPKGTRDFYGKDFAFRKQISEKILNVLGKYGFQQVQTPIIESLELLQAMAGKEVTEQIYTLIDKGGRQLGLRSDITPALTRLFVNTATSLTKPIKYSCFDRVYRYERPQEGRYREIYQINAEEFGAPSGIADAEILACMYACYEAIGLADIEIIIGFRPLLEAFVAGFGISRSEQEEVIRILDKSNKISEEEFVASLATCGIQQNQLPRLKEFLRLQGGIDEALQKAKSFFCNDKQCLGYIKNLGQILDLLGFFGIKNKCLLQLGLARGSEYYTGIIFEVKSAKFNMSIGGGGRYDKLVPTFGGNTTPALGFSIGFDRLMDVLKKFEDVKEIGPDIFVAFDSANEYCKREAIKLASKLRKRNQIVELNLLPKSISEQTELAQKKGVKKIYILDEDSVKKGEVVIVDTADNSRRVTSLDLCYNSTMQIMRARVESAQHILQHILIREYQAEQVAYEIYDDRIRLVVKSPIDLTQIPVQEFEEKVNAVIKQNLPVTDATYKRSEIPTGIDLTLAPENVDDIRVVSIGDFDAQPCHNLHVSNTSEIGTYRLIELKKDGKDTYKFISQVLD